MQRIVGAMFVTNESIYFYNGTDDDGDDDDDNVVMLRPIIVTLSTFESSPPIASICC